MRRILVTGAGGAAAANFVHSLRLAPEPFFVVGSDASKFHPQPEQEVLTLARNHDRVGAATLLPSVEAVALCQDKAAFAARIAEAGLPAPRFARPASEDELRDATESILETRERAWV